MTAGKEIAEAIVLAGKGNGTRTATRPAFTAPLNEIRNLDGVYRHTALARSEGEWLRFRFVTCLVTGQPKAIGFCNKFCCRQSAPPFRRAQLPTPSQPRIFAGRALGLWRTLTRHGETCFPLAGSAWQHRWK